MQAQTNLAMPYDGNTAECVRRALLGRPGLEERKMMGGVWFMVGGRRRRFACVSCGSTTHVDVNAALEIRRRAQSARTTGLPRERISLMLHDAA